MHWYLEVLRKYAVFDGRSRRKEYWVFVLINWFITMALVVVEMTAGLQIAGSVGILSMLFMLAIFVPGLAVTVRRLHDTGRSGWWMLIALIPMIGGLALLIFMLMDSEPGENVYGPNPKSGMAMAA